MCNGFFAFIRSAGIIENKLLLPGVRINTRPRAWEI